MEGGRLGIAPLHALLAYAGHHDAAETFRAAPDGTQQRDRPHREADGVDNLAIGRKRREDPALEVGVGPRVMRLRGRAMPDQIDLDDLSAGIGEQVWPAVASPVEVERGSEPVDEQNRFGAHARDRTRWLASQATRGHHPGRDGTIE